MNFLEKLLLIVSGKAVLDNVCESSGERTLSGEEEHKINRLIERNKKTLNRIKRRRKREEKEKEEREREEAEWLKNNPPIPEDQWLPEVKAIADEWKTRCERVEKEYLAEEARRERRRKEKQERGE